MTDKEKVIKALEEWYQKHFIKGWKDYLHEAFIGAWTPTPKKYRQLRKRKVGEVK